MRKINQIGKRYGRLVVIDNDKPNVSPSGSKQTRVICRCDCGVVKSYMIENIKRGTRSCGCYQAENPPRKTHGMFHTRQYGIWNQMIMRCNNKNSTSYRRYGAKGVVVCERWKTFNGFWADMKEGYQDSLTLDRIDNKKGYSKENCRWATQGEQQNNRTNNRILEYDGKSMTLTEWSKELSINRGTIQSRLMRGWSVSKALSTPVHPPK